MSDRFTVILPAPISGEERAQWALQLCGGSLTEDDGYAGGSGYGYGWGTGDGCGYGYGEPGGDGRSATEV